MWKYHSHPSNRFPIVLNLSTPACTDFGGDNNTINFIHNQSPCIHTITTAEFSNVSNITNTSIVVSGELIPSTEDDAIKILSQIRKKYVKNIIVGHLNINTLVNKFDALKLIITDKLDILVLVETKLDDSFSENQFIIQGYTKPYRLDRNRNGGGVLIYVRKDIPSKQLKKHNFSKSIEALFVEINLRKTKFLLVGTYNSTHPVYGTNDLEFFQQIGFALDVYSNYEKFLLAGDFNVQIGEHSIDDFLDEYAARNLVKDFTCFKSTSNPSSRLSLKISESATIDFIWFKNIWFDLKVFQSM